MTTSLPNFFDDAFPWNRVRVAGLLVLACAVKFNGIALEGQWKKQKSKDASGAVFSFQGMDPVGGEQGFSITFRITNREEKAQLYPLWDALKPVPVAGGAASSTSSSSSSTSTPTTGKVGSPPSAESILADLKKSLASLNNPTPAATGSTADATTAASAAAAQPSPGPRPPTVPIELGWLQFLGCFAVALRKWEFDLDPEKADRFDVTLTFIHDSPPKQAATGAMSAPKGTGPSAGGTATAASTTTPLFLNAAAGAAGT